MRTPRISTSKRASAQPTYLAGYIPGAELWPLQLICSTCQQRRPHIIVNEEGLAEFWQCTACHNTKCIVWSDLVGRSAEFDTLTPVL